MKMRPVDVLNNLRGWVLWPQSYHLSEDEAKTCIEALEQQKTGHWITTRTFMHDGEYYCDKCKCDSPNNEKWDYCPNCGAKMVEPQESEK